MDSIFAFVRAHAYAGVFVATFIDGTALPFPGRMLLIATGALAPSAGLNVVAIILLGAAGAVLGDHLWYVAGLVRGERVLALYCRVVPRRRTCADRARDYVARYGGFAFIIGRFVAGVRILAAPVAAAAGMRYPRFLLCDVGGALLWSTVFVLLGYAVGARAPALMERLGIVGSVAIGLAVTAAITLVAVAARRLSRSPRGAPRRARDRRRRPAA